MASPKRRSAEEMASKFTEQYYSALRNNAELFRKFYKDNSKISRTGLDGKMRDFTFPDVDEKDLNMLSSSGFDSVKVTRVMSRVMSQDSRGGGLLIDVDGYFSSNVRSAKNFTQKLFLALQGTYFVLTDRFQFHDVPDEANATIPPADNVIEETFPETEEVCEPNHGSENVSEPSNASAVMKEIRTGQGQRSSSCDLYQEIRADAVEDSRNGNSQKTQDVRRSAEEVGNELIKQYYTHLKNSPELLHQLYKDVSKITHPGLDGVMRSYTLQDMVEDPDMLSFGGFDSVEVTSITSQDSHHRCIFVDVYGYITLRERPPRYFTQIFFLAPQENHGYFVYNDMFRFLDMSEDNATISSANAAVTEGKAICIKNPPPHATIALVEDEFKQFGEIIQRSTGEMASKFTEQYYEALRNNAEYLRKFYKDNSKISRTGLDGKMRDFTFPDVDEKDLNMLSSSGFDSVEVTRVMSQDSRGRGLLIDVDGYFSSNVRTAKNFTQKLFLAPQGTAYFVLTDKFQFHDVPDEANATIPPADNVIEETIPETEEVCEPNHGSENVPKLSYASVVMKEPRAGQGQRSSSCDLYQERKADAVEDSRNGNSQKSQAASEGAIIYVTWLPPNATIALVENAFKQFGKIRRGGIELRSKKFCKDAFVEFEEADAANRALMASPIMLDGRKTFVEKKRPYYVTIHLKNLPPNATIASVEDAFKQFGEIRRGGIRVQNKMSFSYGFVEFKEENAAQRAIEASPIMFGSHSVSVERKRPKYKSQHSSSCDHTGNGNSQESQESGQHSSSRDDTGNGNSQESQESGYGESPSVEPGNINRGEEVGGPLGDNPYWNWEKMMEEVRGTEVWQKLMMGSRVPEDYYDIRNWEKIMEEEQMKFQEEQRKIQEDEGRQYNQNKYEQMKEALTGGVGQILEEEEEEDQN